MMYLRDHGFPQVGGALLLSPWLDLSTSFNSWEENAVRARLALVLRYRWADQPWVR